MWKYALLALLWGFIQYDILYILKLKGFKRMLAFVLFTSCFIAVIYFMSSGFEF